MRSQQSEMSRRQLLSAGVGLAGVAAGTGFGDASTDGAPLATAPGAPAMGPIYLQVTGARQGLFAGDGPNGQMVISGFSFDFGADTSYAPLQVTKPVDRATAQFLSARLSSEVLNTVTISMSQKGASANASPFYVLTISDAQLYEFDTYTNSGIGVLESLSFGYQQLKLKVAGKTALFKKPA